MYEPKPKLKISSFNNLTKLAIRKWRSATLFLLCGGIAWYWAVLYVIAWLFYGITWYTMSVFHGIEWYCMMLQWSSTLIYQLRAQGHKIKSLYLKHGINRSLLVGQFCNLISFCSIKRKLLLWPGQMVRSKSFKAFLHFFVSVIWSTWQRSATHFHLSKTNVATKGSSSYCCLLTHVWNKSDCYKT